VIRILDFGAGGGAHTWYLSREGFSTYAFDGSPSAISNIKRRLNKEGLKAELSIQDALNINYPNDFFDAVIDNVCIYANSIANIKVMYGNIIRILKDGGKLLTVCFGKLTTGYGKGEEIEKDTFINITEGNLMNRGKTHFFDTESINGILLEIGYKNIHNDKIDTDNGSTIELIMTIAEK